MARLVLFIIPILIACELNAQEIKIYNPEANAAKDISTAIVEGTKTGKHIFLQIGGNWCPWCIKFHNFVDADNEIKSYVESNFVVVKVNYDTKNKNEEILKQLGFPQRFGFPVFVILDGNGNRIHTQNSAYLEKEKSYDRTKVLEFFKHWSPIALNPDSYKVKEKTK